MVRIKVCGITNIEDALTAAEMGVDALGFIFARSPRRVMPEQARDIIRLLPPFVKTVGVFVDKSLSAIEDIKNFCGLDLIQLHGNESPEFCRSLMPHTIKAFRLRDTSSLSAIKSYRDCSGAILLDTYQKGLKGGTGKICDWDLAVEAMKKGIPAILSGGLNPSNIRRAISTVKPEAVDINSGIEVRPGKKDPGLMQQVMEQINKIDAGGDSYDPTWIPWRIRGNVHTRNPGHNI